MSAEERVLLFAPGFEYPEGVTRENPLGNHAVLAKKLGKLSMETRLVYPNWLDMRDPEYPEFEVMDAWQCKIGDAVEDLRDEGRRFMMAGHSLGADAILRFVGDRANGLRDNDTPLDAIFLFSPSPFANDSYAYFRYLYESGYYQRSDYANFPPSLRDELLEPVPIPPSKIPLHITVGALDRLVNHMRALTIFQEGKSEKWTIGTVEGVGHNLPADNNYMDAAVEVMQDAISGEIYEKRKPPKGRMINLTIAR